MKKLLILLFLLASCSYSEKECKDCVLKAPTEVVNSQISTNVLDINKMGNKKILIYSAIWCPYCQAEYKHLQQIYDIYGKDMDIATVVLGDVKKEDVEKYMKENNFTFPIYYDTDSALARKFNIKYFPTIFLLNNNGQYVELDSEGLNLNDYQKMLVDSIDSNMKEKLAKYEVLDINGEKATALSKVLNYNDSIVVYGAPWCKDCVKEIDRLNSIKGKRNLIYLIDSSKFTYEQYKEYAKDKKDVYYVTSQEFRKDFNIKWIPSVLEVKSGKITTNFIRNDKILVK